MRRVRCIGVGRGIGFREEGGVWRWGWVSCVHIMSYGRGLGRDCGRQEGSLGGIMIDRSSD